MEWKACDCDHANRDAKGEKIKEPILQIREINDFMYSKLSDMSKLSCSINSPINPLYELISAKNLEKM